MKFVKVSSGKYEVINFDGTHEAWIVKKDGLWMVSFSDDEEAYPFYLLDHAKSFIIEVNYIDNED